MPTAYTDVGSGPPLVLLHAFPLDRRMWRPLAGSRLLAPDLPGFGDAARTVPSIDAMADVVAEFIRAVVGQTPVALGGCSMGGYVALAFARKYPERLRKLILIDTKAEADDAAARANRDKQLAEIASRTLTAAALIAGMLPKMLATPEAVEEVRALGGAQSLEGIAAGIRALRDRPDASDGLGNIRVPTLVVVGEYDTITPASAARALHERIAGSRLAVVPGAAHLSNLDRPDAFTTLLREFLAEATP